MVMVVHQESPSQADGPTCLLILVWPKVPRTKVTAILLSASVAMVRSKIGDNRFLFFFANIYSVPPGVGTFPAHIQVLPFSPLREHGFEFLLEGLCEPF